MLYRCLTNFSVPIYESAKKHDDFVQFLQHHIGNPNARLYLATYYAECGNYKKVLNLYKMGFDDTSGDLYIELGIYLLRNQKQSHATLLLYDALAHNPDYEDIVATINLYFTTNVIDDGLIIDADLGSPIAQRILELL